MEVLYDTRTSSVKVIKSFACTEDLEPYLGMVNITEIYALLKEGGNGTVFRVFYSRILLNFSRRVACQMQYGVTLLHVNMCSMNQKIANVTIDVPYKRSGGIIFQQPVSFDVFQHEDHYSLKPCLSEEELRVANLPEELLFRIEDEKPVSLRGKIDGNFHVIQDAVTLLRKQQLLV